MPKAKAVLNTRLAHAATSFPIGLARVALAVASNAASPQKRSSPCAFLMQPSHVPPNILHPAAEEIAAM